MKTKEIIAGIVLVLAGILLGWLFNHSSNSTMSQFVPVDVRINSEEYQFINPLLFSRTSKELYSDEYKNLNAELNTIVKDFKEQKAATSISVYFRDLNTSHWTGINENQKYDPSSLLKVVLLMTYLRQSLTDPNLLTKKIYYPGENETGQFYKSSVQIPKGDTTVLDLLKIMIVSSDNRAKDVLMVGHEKEFQKTYSDLRLPTPATLATDDYMSARSYSVIFRALYNSTYLPWDISEQALFLLSLTEYKKGINVGIPDDIHIAHKFGEHTFVRASDGVIENRELHDCGIVYYPGHPYLICVMTEGKDFPQLEKVISGISHIVYTYVAENTLKK